MKKNIFKTIIIVFLSVLLDRIIKVLITKLVPLNSTINIIKKVFYITNVHNKGAAFSIMYGETIILIMLSIIFLGLIIFYMYKNNKYNIEYSLIIGGLLGNLIDRIIFGYVIDYIGVNIFSYSFPIFNIADSLIVIGAFIFIIRKDKVGDRIEVNSK